MIYEFRCSDCNLIYEEFHKLEDYESRCPECGQKTKHIMSVFNSNFTAWSDTMKRELAWANTPEPDTI